MADHHFQRACVFIDGENFRHSICDLLDGFNRADYLPKSAAWDSLFLHLLSQCNARTLLRTYWYSVAELDVRPYNLAKMARNKDFASLKKVLRYNESDAEQIATFARQELLEKFLLKRADELATQERTMRGRFDGWRTVQNGIATSFNSIEFRRAGSIPYNLFQQQLGSEKGVDVKLATDLITLKDIYDVAIILSGDGDYVPAVQAIKDAGKHVVNVSFLRKSGKLLPGGAWRLNLNVDQTIELKYEEVVGFLLPEGEKEAVS